MALGRGWGTRIPETSEEGGCGQGFRAGRVSIRENAGVGMLGAGACMGVSLSKLTPEA